MACDLLTTSIFIVALQYNFSMAINNWRHEHKTHTRDDWVLGRFQGFERGTHEAENLRRWIQSIVKQFGYQ